MKFLQKTGTFVLMFFTFLFGMSMTPTAYAAPGDSATLFFDDFESASFGKWNTPTSPNWEVNFGSLRGIYGADVEGNTDSNDALQKSVSTLGYENIEISYRFKADNLENDDAVRIQYSTNGGAAWTTVYSIADGEDDHVDGTPTGLYHKFHTLPGNAANNPNFVLRFDPDLVGGPDEAWIDDVMLTGKEVRGTAPAPSPTPVSPAPTPVPPTTTASETSYVACNDGRDNDTDGMTDVFDLDCLDYRQTLSVVTQVAGGTLSPSDFPFSVSMGTLTLANALPGSLAGIEITNPQTGTWRILPQTQPGYTATFGGDCNTSGMLAMGFNIYARCTVTHTFTVGVTTTPTPPPTSPLGAESEYLTCSDATDNDGDGLVDVYDLDCINFRQTAEIITRVRGGTATSSQALMQVRFHGTTTSGVFLGSAGVVEVTNPTTGTWQLLLSVLPGYTPSFSGNCNATGAFSMGFNMRKQCIVTYTFNE